MSHTAREGPASVWIELTSKCPLRCVFCSRENLRGEGEHMDAAVLDAVLRSLDQPEIIRLNYSGESANHPGLIEAIAKVKSLTQAQTEMVTSLVSMPMETLHRLAGSGIDRISVSLHSLDRGTFPIVYGGGTLDSFERRLEILLRAARTEARPPAIDFAFVALQSNVDELPAVAAVAAASGASALSIHPVIRRPGVPAGFDGEAAEDGALTGTFARALEAKLTAAREANPGMHLSVARPPASGNRAGAFTCEQNPFETIHILSNGDVVPCEVMDRTALGNVSGGSVREIWHGPEYRAFRERYSRNEIPECSRCIFRAPATQAGAVRTAWGWHDRDATDTLWSRTACSFECQPRGESSLALTGLLPPGSPSNSVEFLRDGQRAGVIRNGTGQPLKFRVELGLDPGRVNRFTARTESGFSAWRRGLSSDARELGFALFNAEFCEAARAAAPPMASPVIMRPALQLKRKAASLLLNALGPLERMAAAVGPPRITPEPPADSLGVVIPERGDGTILAVCLAALEAALAKVPLPTRVVIVVNGSRSGDYAKLATQYPRFRFLFITRPLGFTAAIRAGLRHIGSGWTYLLNNDMSLDPNALAAVLRHRTPSVFSLASRIRMTSMGNGRETNRTAIAFVDGLVNLVELEDCGGGPVEHFYSGGGSSLFQTAWLRRLIARTACYDPFYWEDAEWGAWARRLGLMNLFVPGSSVEHTGKVTVSRFYDAGEVARIFERNRVQFQLRCVPAADNTALRERLAHSPWQTLRELLHPARVASMARTRAELAVRPELPESDGRARQ